MFPEITARVVTVVEDRATVDLFLTAAHGPVWLNRVDVRLPSVQPPQVAQSMAME